MSYVWKLYFAIANFCNKDLENFPMFFQELMLAILTIYVKLNSPEKYPLSLTVKKQQEE